MRKKRPDEDWERMESDDNIVRVKEIRHDNSGNGNRRKAAA